MDAQGVGPEGEVPSKRDMATLTHAGNGLLLLFGGRLESGRATADAWVFDTTRYRLVAGRTGGRGPVFHLHPASAATPNCKARGMHAGQCTERMHAAGTGLSVRPDRPGGKSTSRMQSL